VGWAHIKGVFGDIEDAYAIYLYFCDVSIGVDYLQAPKLYASYTVYSSPVNALLLSELKFHDLITFMLCVLGLHIKIIIT
jgi:hypothetical protein